MIAKLVGIEEKSIKKGVHIGKPYFILSYMAGNLLKPVMYTDVLVPMHDNPSFAAMQVAEAKRIIAEYLKAKAANQLFDGGAINIKQCIVGDTSVNAAEAPLPMYRTAKRDGTGFNETVHTTMNVFVQLNEDGGLSESPRAKAMRIISQICELVPVSHDAPVVDNNPPV